ncbi:MAG: hypothetical protein AUJ92_10065 [Armatimonadetes bacterium CG2_30_59_28]|nr:PIN domain-containing protein [Armatimonadota bacterium]OIO94465.1 MAG: hypothetical protein AUJ92_10065 [Armatimonadetes bacterium CG2_30_59_28]
MTTEISQLIPLSRSVLERATKVRAFFTIKTPDALHLAAALDAKCDVFYTNDHRLDRFTDIPIDVVEKQTTLT